MEHRIHSHNLDKIEQRAITLELLEEVSNIVQKAPIFIWPNKSSASQKVEKHCILQSMNNAWFQAEFRARGWLDEFPSQPTTSAEYPGYRVDFATPIANKWAMVEVEFGNRARLDSDFRKMHDAYNWGRLHVGIIITPCIEMANLSTGGSATYNQAYHDVHRCHPDTIPYPLQLIGLEYKNATLIDMSKSGFPSADYLSGMKVKPPLYHAIAQIRAGVPVEEIRMPNMDEEDAAMAQFQKKARKLDTQIELF